MEKRNGMQIIEPDPSFVAAPHRGAQPEVELLFTLLKDALCRYVAGDDEPHGWIFEGECAAEVVSFEHVCDVVGVSADRVRRFAMRRKGSPVP